MSPQSGAIVDVGGFLCARQYTHVGGVLGLFFLEPSSTTSLDGKLYGREPMFAVICKAALLPDGAKNHDIQKNKTVAQIGQLLITLLRVLCANTAWQRRKLGKILQDWRIIYVQICLLVMLKDLLVMIVIALALLETTA
ncbi:hypothetical protein ACS0TY_025149 [Phlomoides rotata]